MAVAAMLPYPIRSTRQLSSKFETDNAVDRGVLAAEGGQVTQSRAVFWTWPRKALTGPTWFRQLSILCNHKQCSHTNLDDDARCCTK